MNTFKTKKNLIYLLLASFLIIGLLNSGATKPAKFSFDVSPGAGDEFFCSNFDMQLHIEDFGSLPLDEGVCVHWDADLDIDQGTMGIEDWIVYLKKRDEYQYNAEDARGGIDTDTLRVTVAGDKALVEWRTIPQGSGGHTALQYEVYQKNQPEPLISRKIKVYARGGIASSVVEELTIKKFTKNRLEVQVDCSESDFIQIERPSYSWDEYSQSYVSRTNLRSTATYRFLDDGKVALTSTQFLYKDGPLKSKQDIAKAFQIKEDDVQQQPSGPFELNLDKERFENLFAPRRDETASSLYSLTHARNS